MKNIFHLSTDFQNQKLYSHLVSGFRKSGLAQSIYIQHRGGIEDVGSEYDYPGARVVVSCIYRWWMKFFFSARVSVIFKDICKRELLSSNTLIVAYFLMTDGAVAYRLRKAFGSPYIVSVRNTDINLYLKYRFWLRPRARRILEEADYVILASPAYIRPLRKILGEEFFEFNVEPKLKIIGNIIDSSWFSVPRRKVSSNGATKLIFVGEFSENKRVTSIIEAYSVLRTRSDFELTLVGNYGGYVNQIRRAADKVPGVTVVDRVSDVEKLISIVDAHHIFIMPSRTETFGMAYIEAMARGLPVIYTKGQGIDGYFVEGFVGSSVTEPLVESIVTSVQSVLENYDILSENALEVSIEFKSDKIIRQYLEVFDAVTVGVGEIRNGDEVR